MMNYKKIIKLIISSYFPDKRISNISKLRAILNLWIKLFNNKLNKGVLIDGDRIDTKEYSLNETPLIDQETLFNVMYPLFQRAVKTGHPLMLKNLNPSPTLSSISSEAIANVFLPNGCSEEMSGNIILCEKIVTNIVSKLLGLTNDVTGFFTFGGTGTIFYSLFVSIRKLKEKFKDIKIEDIVIIAPVAAHEALKKSMIWQHLDLNNLLELPVDENLTTDYTTLYEVIYQQHLANKKVAMVYSSFGTTSNFAMDDTGKVVEIISSITPILGYKPHLHIDSVAGWIFSCFRDYDFGNNKLGFEDEVLEMINYALSRMKGFAYADSFGIDFHKTGYVSYISSFVIFNQDVSKQLYIEKGEVPHLYNDGCSYNPGKFTLETSRSASKMISTLFSLKSLGKEGLMSLWGGAIINGLKIEAKISKLNNGIFLSNKRRFGSDVLLKVTPFNIQDDALYFGSKAYREYSMQFYTFITQHVMETNLAIGFTRSSSYIDGYQPIPGLRLYPLSPHLSERDIIYIVKSLKVLKEKFDVQYGSSY